MSKWQTVDYYLTVFLHTQGYDVEIAPNSTPGKAIFLIEDDERRKELVEQYLHNEATVNPLTFKHSAQIVKSMMYNR